MNEQVDEVTMGPRGLQALREYFGGVSRRQTDAGIAFIVLIVTAILFSSPLRWGGDLLGYAQDDFYYYLTVARNLASGAGSTFDGVTHTNGYHPLYELLLWGMAGVTHSLRGVYKLLWLLDVASAMTIFLANRAIFARKLASVWLSNGFALIVLYLCTSKLYHQMEVTLTMPLGFLFLLLLDRAPEEMTVRKAFGTGLVGGLLILSRLDAGLLVALCVGGMLLHREYRRTLTWRKMLAFVGGCAPMVLVYLLVNQHYFHRWLPISGAAKQLRSTHGILLSAIIDSTSAVSALIFASSLVALVALPWIWRRFPVQVRILTAAGLLFPFVHWGINLWVSDWKLWGWYGYSLRFSMTMILLMVGAVLVERAGSRVMAFLPATVCAGAMLCLFLARYTVDPTMVDIATTAQQIRAFARTHPGKYAMGDRAGMVGYVSDQQTIQTEGLMMDDAYLEHIKRQDQLKPVLGQYGVDYYVGFIERGRPSPVVRKNSHLCFEAREPAQGGPGSPAMHDEFCDPPVREFVAKSGKTMIFDLHHGEGTEPITR